MHKMKKLLIQFILPILSVFTLASCHHNDGPKIPETAERTVLVYQVAGNNLGNNGWDMADIKEMRQAAQAGAIGHNHLLVYNSRWSGTTLVEILPDRIDTIKVYDNSALSVSSQRMKEVLADVRKLRAADGYGLVLWSHGTGWIQDGISDPLDKPKRSFGSEDNGKKMNITTLARTLEDENLEFLYFDCCLMGSIETLYELRDVAPVIASSPTELPNPGMPYHLNVGPFFRSGSADILTAARNTFEYYNAIKDPIDRTCSMTVIDPSKLEALAAATKAIYERATDIYPSDFEPQRYEDGVVLPYKYYDFRQYVNALCTTATGEERFEGASQLAAEFNRAFSDVVIYFAATPKLWSLLSLADATGLTTNILRNADDALKGNYSTLGWYTDVASSLKLK